MNLQATGLGVGLKLYLVTGASYSLLQCVTVCMSAENSPPEQLSFQSRETLKRSIKPFIDTEKVSGKAGRIVKETLFLRRLIHTESPQ